MFIKVIKLNNGWSIVIGINFEGWKEVKRKAMLPSLDGNKNRTRKFTYILIFFTRCRWKVVVVLTVILN